MLLGTSGWGVSELQSSERNVESNTKGTKSTRDAGIAVANGNGSSLSKFRSLVRSYPLDALAWCMALALAALLRYESNSAVPWSHLGWMMVIAVLLQMVYGWVLMLYRGRHVRGSFDSLRLVMTVVAAVGVTLWVATLVLPGLFGVARTVPIIATAIAMLATGGIRYLDRYARERLTRPTAEGEPVLILGAGHVGDHLGRQLVTDTQTTLRPVGFLDDDPSKRKLMLHGVPVLGNLADLPQIVASTNATTLIVAIGSKSPELLQQVQDAALPLGVRVQLVPPMEEMLRLGIKPSSLRDLRIEDLLGRPQVDTDVSQIAGYLNGKTVLVTGAGGSIGSQLCVEINKHGPAELILLDRDETGLQQTEIEIRGNGLLDTNEVVLADIRDRDTLRSIFEDRKPDVVFHAAALKHLPMLEQYPDEAWKTNIHGTLNVIDACTAAGVETLINISTDKAANPTSVLGLSKRVAERLVSWQGNQSDLRYLSVRFGNVIGSRGSMLPTFRTLIEEGKPVTVTHPDATRYFMTIPEACQLVLQAGAIGRVGEVLILDMGEPVSILGVANKMIAMSGKKLEVRFTGLRAGEKLHEELHSDFEVEVAPLHPKISHAPVLGLHPDELDKGGWNALVATSPHDRAQLAHSYEKRCVPEDLLGFRARGEGHAR